MAPVGCSAATSAGAAGAASVWRCGAVAGRGAARRGGNGDDAITLMSGSTVWADAPDGTIDSPIAIAAATDARRPTWQMSRFLNSRPSRRLTTPLPVLAVSFGRFPAVCRWIKFQIRPGTFGNASPQPPG